MGFPANRKQWQISAVTDNRNCGHIMVGDNKRTHALEICQINGFGGRNFLNNSFTPSTVLPSF